ncbi:MAG: site-specific DNA-methyltransferase [Thermodesulfobacteriota bacterium]
MQRIASAITAIHTSHRLVRADARCLVGVEDQSVQLVITSPPYWTLKEYRPSQGQLGHIENYEEFLAELDRVWTECFRVLVPGGRLIIVVGDVCLSRKAHGRHEVVPLHASIVEHCRAIGFANLAPIIWHKIANAKYEVENGGGFLGKPYEPNAIIKNDIEFVLMQRKPGGYRSPSIGMRLLSVISEVDHREWFRQVWSLPGASTRDHPAPFPVKLAERLIRMFSFVGDVVLDPFVGTGTSCVAAARSGRNSIGFEVDEHYFSLARTNVATLATNLFRTVSLTTEDSRHSPVAPSASAGREGHSDSVHNLLKGNQAASRIG